MAGTANRRLRFRLPLPLLLCAALLVAAPAWAGNAQPRYDFRIGMWRNLHQLLHAQAQAEAGVRRAVRLQAADAELPAEATAEQHSAWRAARAHYVAHLADRNLLFDDDLRAIGNALGDAGSAPRGLEGAAVPDELRRALEAAAPAYLAHGWPRHQAEADAWIARLRPLLARHGPRLKSRQAEVYRAPWPQEPVAVDVAAYANREGAYTTLGPVRITVSALDDAIQDAAALEILMHETAHAMAGPLRTGLETRIRAAQAAGLATDNLSRDLWHQALFYLSGRVTAEELPGYVPFADANALWGRAWPMRNRDVLEAAFTPYLRGKTGFEQALDALVAGLAAPRPEPDPG